MQAAMTPRTCTQDLQQLGSPTYARVQGGPVPSPPSLPDLEALNPSEVQPEQHPELQSVLQQQTPSTNLTASCSAWRVTQADTWSHIANCVTRLMETHRWHPRTATWRMQLATAHPLQPACTVTTCRSPAWRPALLSRYDIPRIVVHLLPLITNSESRPSLYMLWCAG